MAVALRPLVPGDLRLGRHRRDRPALPARRATCRPPAASARSAAVGVVAALRRHDHAAAGPAGAVRAVAVLAVRARTTPKRRWVTTWRPTTGCGPGWRAASAGGPARSGSARAAALVVLTLGIGNLSIGLPGAEAFTKEVGSVTGQRLIEAHYPAARPHRPRSSPPPARADQVVAAARAVDGVAEVRPPERSPDGRWVRIAGGAGRRAGQPTRPRTPSSGCATAVHAVPGAQALVGGDTAHRARHRTGRRPGRPGGHAADPGGGLRHPGRCCCGRWSRRCCCWPAWSSRTRPRWARPG